MNLYLNGYRGTGKTTIGRMVAAELEMPHADLDEIIVRRTGKTVAEIFSEQGEAAFRDLEAEELGQFDGEEPTVVSLGGGTCLDRDNREWMGATGLTIWLTLPAEMIHQRLQADANSAAMRPPLTDLPPLEEIQAVLDSRRDIYISCASTIMNTARMKPEEVCRRICEWWNKRR